MGASGLIFSLLACGRALIASAMLSILAALLIPAPAAGQLGWGIHLAEARDAFGGSYGAGVRVGGSLPILPVDLFLTGEQFLPECPSGSSGCGLQGMSVEANFRLVFPVLRPYLSAGAAYRRFRSGGSGPDLDNSGLTFGAGVDLGLGRVRLFGEGRYEFVEAPERQQLIRIGILLIGP